MYICIQECRLMVLETGSWGKYLGPVFPCDFFWLIRVIMRPKNLFSSVVHFQIWHVCKWLLFINRSKHLLAKWLLLIDKGQCEVKMSLRHLIRRSHSQICQIWKYITQLKRCLTSQRPLSIRRSHSWTCHEGAIYVAFLWVTSPD